MVVKCPKCNKLLEVPNEKLGKKEVCEHCENIFVVDESVIYQAKEDILSEIKPEQKTKPVVQGVSEPKAKRRSKVPLIIGSVIGLIVVVFVIAIGVSAVVETKKEEARQEELQRWQEENQRRQAEEIRRQQEEIRRRQNAYQQIIVEDIDFEGALFEGGINLKSITLSNPTKYAFRSIRYQFYDADDNVVRIDNYVGPLMPHETKKFSINLHCPGLWEHAYDVRIVEAEVVE